MSKIIIYGNTAAAIQSLYDFSTDSEHDVVAFTVNRSEVRETEFCGLPLIPFDEVEKIYPPNEYKMFVAIYYNRVNKIRRQYFEEAKAKGYELVSYVSSKAIVWPDLEIGENCMICDGANVRPYTKIGVNTFIMPNVVVGHDCIVDDHCYLAIGAVMLAGSKVCTGSVIGGNATILNGITVANSCIVGAGAVMNKNTKEKEVYTVNPPVLQALSSDQLANLIFKVQV